MSAQGSSSSEEGRNGSSSRRGRRSGAVDTRSTWINSKRKAGAQARGKRRSKKREKCTGGDRSSGDPRATEAGGAAGEQNKSKPGKNICRYETQRTTVAKIRKAEAVDAQKDGYGGGWDSVGRAKEDTKS